MRLVVPAIMDEGFFDGMAGLPVSHFYGAIAGDVGLRANRWLPQPEPERLAGLLEGIHANGQEFWYCLNVSCLGNREFTADGQRWLVERLGWLSDTAFDGVVLSNPYLIAFAKRRFPGLPVAVSTANAIDSVDKALHFESQGADVLYLPEYVNRNLPLLRQLRKRVRARLVLLANVGCLMHCPIRQYHINLVSHSNESLEVGAYVDYPLLWCTKEKVADPARMLKAPWIRPEDLSLYEEIGIDEFKLAGREMDRPWVERVTRAFAARRWDGDLNDLILGFDHLEPFGEMPVRVPNRSLDGFVDFFRKKHDCREGCRDCRYCDDWATDVAAPGAGRERFIERLGKAIERFEAGSFRTVSGR